MNCEESMLEYINVRNEVFPERSEAFLLKERKTALWKGVSFSETEPVKGGDVKKKEVRTC